jgi:hypothetical protein
LELEQRQKGLRDGLFAIKPDQFEKNGEIDFKAYYAARDQYLGKLPAQEREFLLADATKNETAADRYYRTIVVPLIEKYNAVPSHFGTPEQQARYRQVEAIYNAARYPNGTAEAGRQALVKAGLARSTQEAGALFSAAFNAKNPARAELRGRPEFQPYRAFYATPGTSTTNATGVSGTVRSGSGGNAVPSGQAGTRTGSGAAPSRTEVDGLWNQYNSIKDTDKRAAFQFYYDNFDKLYFGAKNVPERPTKPPTAEQYAARDRLSAIGAEYGRIKNIDSRQAAAYWQSTTAERARLEAIRDGKPVPSASLAPVVSAPRTTSSPVRSGGGGGGGGGAPRGAPAPAKGTTKTPPASVPPVTQAVGLELGQALVDYYSGKGPIPDEARLLEIRKRYSLGVPLNASMATWLATLKRFIMTSQAA